jgi:1,4-dihydroxy-2-naphthoyl-CoA hydrolase
MFKYKTQILLHHSDAAGLLFFANQLVLIHEAYEKFFQHIGFSFGPMLKKREYFLPIVHAESDYKKPLYVGDEITIAIKVTHLGNTSIIFNYEIYNKQKGMVGSAKTIHVAINPKTHTKITLPPKVRKILEKYKS